jgi:hypothetical protein
MMHYDNLGQQQQLPQQQLLLQQQAAGGAAAAFAAAAVAPAQAPPAALSVTQLLQYIGQVSWSDNQQLNVVRRALATAMVERAHAPPKGTSNHTGNRKRGRLQLELQPQQQEVLVRPALYDMEGGVAGDIRHKLLSSIARSLQSSCCLLIPHTAAMIRVQSCLALPGWSYVAQSMQALFCFLPEMLSYYCCQLLRCCNPCASSASAALLTYNA